MIHKSTQKTCYETGAENCRNPIKNVPAVPTYKACIHSPAAVQEKIMKDNTKIQDVKIKAKQQKKDIKPLAIYKKSLFILFIFMFSSLRPPINGKIRLLHKLNHLL